MGPVEGDADIYDTNCQTRSGLCNNFPILWMLLTQRYNTNWQTDHCPWESLCCQHFYQAAWDDFSAISVLGYIDFLPSSMG